MSLQKIDIATIIRKENIHSYFQPIISFKSTRIIGWEALSRSMRLDQSIIGPFELFQSAKERALTVDLDRLCRKRALEGYASFQNCNTNLLFINIDASIIDQGVVGSEHLINTTRQYGLNPSNIVLEIIENKVEDLDALERFVSTYKHYGYHIALDDVGTGGSNWDRIALVQPDILKIDKSLVRNINEQFYQQEIFQSLCKLAKKIGALVIAEGIETEEEAYCVLELGADFIQGFYFCHPQPINECQKLDLQDIIFLQAQNYKAYRFQQIRKNAIKHKEYERILYAIVSPLTQNEPDCFNEILQVNITHHTSIECSYILDSSGRQVSETIFNQNVLVARKSPFFSPASTGFDHSLKEYYYLLHDTGLATYTTEPYISLATGNICTTMSITFNQKHRTYLLCLDFSLRLKP